MLKTRRDFEGRGGDYPALKFPAALYWLRFDHIQEERFREAARKGDIDAMRAIVAEFEEKNPQWSAASPMHRMKERGKA